jgi:hypothetical protein
LCAFSQALKSLPVALELRKHELAFGVLEDAAHGGAGHCPALAFEGAH